MELLNAVVFSYQLSDGQFREETGELKKIGDVEVYVITGSYSFIGSDGKTYRVRYSAGENGYKANVSGELQVAHPFRRNSQFLTF